MKNRIALAKKRLGLDNSGLGEKLGVHRTTIGRWEEDPDKITGPASKLLDQLLAFFPAQQDDKVQVARSA